MQLLPTFSSVSILSGWIVPEKSQQALDERITFINTNGNWVLALTKEYMLWAKPSGWQDGNRKIWDKGWGTENNP